MTNHPNRGKHHRIQISLLGGHGAIVDWNENEDEGDVVMGEAFLTYIHEHTRKDAIAKAGRLAPHVTSWQCVSGW